MALNSHTAGHPPARFDDDGPRTFSNGYIFRVPVRDFGWFASILTGLATGMAAFFASTFVAIMLILFWNAAGHNVDYAWSYTRVGFWVGLVVMVLALAYFAKLWVSRKLRP